MKFSHDHAFVRSIIIAMCIAGWIDSGAVASPPSTCPTDVGPKYVAPEGTGPRTIDGKDYRYIATGEREKQIIAGFAKLKVGQMREEVREAMGPPDTAGRMYKKTPEFIGWSYSYEIKMREMTNTNDVLVQVFFDPDGHLEWASPSNA